MTKVLIEVKGEIDETKYAELERMQKELSDLGIEVDLIGSRPKTRG